MKSISTILVISLTSVASMAQLATSHSAVPGIKPAAGITGHVATAATTVARVNGTPLTDRDLLRMEYAIFPYARQHSGGVPKSMEPQIRKGALDMVIFEELVYQEAMRRKMTIPAERLSQAEHDLRAQFQDASSFKQYMAEEYKGSREILRQKIRRSMLIEKLLKMETTDRSAVSLAEAKAFYSKNPDRFAYGESFSIQSISILPPANATVAQLADAKKRAEEAFSKAKAAKNYQEFGLLAEKLSEDDFRVNMGDHRQVSVEKLPPEVVKVIATMQPGQTSDLLQLGTAYTIFRMNAHTPAGVTKFEDVKERLRADLQKEKFNQLRADLGTKLRKSAAIEVVN